MFARRDFLRLTALAALTPIGLRLGQSGARADDDGVYLRSVWRHVGLQPVVTSPIPGENGPPEGQRMFPTLLPAGWLIPSALDAWYLWLWTHDTNRIYLYTAPSPRGPYTFRGHSAAPSSFPSGYDPNHVSSGDIVWDPIGSRFIASPHSLRWGRVEGNGESCQDSFLLESTNGINWSFLDGDNRPRLVCGPPGSPDSVHTGYGRLLRDLDGYLHKFDGRYWWLYRAQRRDEDPDVEHPTQDGNVRSRTIYRPRLASAESLSTAPWTKHEVAWTTTMANSGLFDVGSFIRAAAVHNAVGALGTALTFPTQPYLDRTTADSMEFLPTSVPFDLVMPDATNGLSGGANIVRHPETGVQFAVAVASDVAAGNYEVWLFRGVPD